MTLLFIVLVGGLVGALTSPMVRGSAWDAGIADVALGAAGSLVGGFALSPWLSAPISGSRASAEALAVAVIGALMAVAVASLVRRTGTRYGRMNPPTTTKARTTRISPITRT